MNANIFRAGDWVRKIDYRSDPEWPFKQRRVQVESVSGGLVVIGGKGWDFARFKSVNGPKEYQTVYCGCGCGEPIRLKYFKKNYKGFKRGHFPRSDNHARVRAGLTDEQRLLVVDNIQWAESGAYRHFRLCGGKHPIDELKSASYLGLIEGVLRFDSSKGATFKTYAFYWIEKELRDVWRAQQKAEGWRWVTRKGETKFVRLANVHQWPRDEDGEEMDFRDMPERRLA